MVLICGPVVAQDISGVAHVVDGDTIDVDNFRIRIEGIDAFETGQNCIDADEQQWACGKAAKEALRKIASGRSVECDHLGEDPYGRIIGSCRVSDGDIGRLMIATGLAFAFTKFSDTYIEDEKLAIFAKSGAWAGEFTFPWKFRANGWSVAAQNSPDPSCPIKGNISSSGQRIYHLPHSRDYQRTKINTRKGERWFCDEAEAQSAGWRAPRSF